MVQFTDSLLGVVLRLIENEGPAVSDVRAASPVATEQSLDIERVGPSGEPSDEERGHGKARSTTRGDLASA